MVRSLSDLASLGRKELQQLCKTHNLKANQKNADLVASLAAVLFPSGAEEDSTPANAVTVDLAVHLSPAPVQQQVQPESPSVGSSSTSSSLSSSSNNSPVMAATVTASLTTITAKGGKKGAAAAGKKGGRKAAGKKAAAPVVQEEEEEEEEQAEAQQVKDQQDMQPQPPVDEQQQHRDQDQDQEQPAMDVAIATTPSSVFSKTATPKTSNNTTPKGSIDSITPPHATLTPQAWTPVMPAAIAPAPAPAQSGDVLGEIQKMLDARVQPRRNNNNYNKTQLNNWTVDVEKELIDRTFDANRSASKKKDAAQPAKGTIAYINQEHKKMFGKMESIDEKVARLNARTPNKSTAATSKAPSAVTPKASYNNKKADVFAFPPVSPAIKRKQDNVAANNNNINIKRAKTDTAPVVHKPMATTSKPVVTATKPTVPVAAAPAKPAAVFSVGVVSSKPRIPLSAMTSRPVKPSVAPPKIVAAAVPVRPALVPTKTVPQPTTATKPVAVKQPVVGSAVVKPTVSKPIVSSKPVAPAVAKPAVAAAATAAGARKFDLQQSLKRPLGYKPHTGPIKKTAEPVVVSSSSSSLPVVAAASIVEQIAPAEAEALEPAPAPVYEPEQPPMFSDSPVRITPREAKKDAPKMFVTQRRKNNVANQQAKRHSSFAANRRISAADSMVVAA